MKIEDYLKREIIYVENDNYIGIAKDNIHVILGSNKLDVEKYLKDYPSPENW